MSKEELFILMSHAQDLQKQADTQLAAVGETLKGIEEGTGEAVAALIREDIKSSLAEANTALTEAAKSVRQASQHARTTSDLLRRTGLFQGLFLVAVAIILMAVIYCVINFVAKGYVEELAALKAKTEKEQATLNELSSKTWGLELRTYSVGTRGIILPKDTIFDRTVTQNGRIAVIIR